MCRIPESHYFESIADNKRERVFTHTHEKKRSTNSQINSEILKIAEPKATTVKMATVLLEARPYRPFKSSEEYLYAMREDLAEWMNTMYPDLRINVDNFMDRLDTGVALCKVSLIFNIYLYKKILPSSS